MFGDESGWRQADLEVSAGIRIRLAPTSRLLRGNTRLINPLMNRIMWNCYIIHSCSSSFRKQRYWAAVLLKRILSLFHSNTYRDQPTNKTIHKIFSLSCNTLLYRRWCSKWDGHFLIWWYYFLHSAFSNGKNKYINWLRRYRGALYLWTIWFVKQLMSFQNMLNFQFH